MKDRRYCLSKPTRRAFQFIRTPVGWSDAPISTIKREDAIPTVDPDPILHHSQGDQDASQQLVYDDIPALLPTNCSDSSFVPVAVPLGTQAAVELEADQYAELWFEGACSLPLPIPCEPAPPVLTAESLRDAALTFPIGTGVGTENVAPRAFARLSAATLANLALFVQAPGQS